MGRFRTTTILSSEYSLGSYDIPQNLAIGYGVDLPFGRGKRFLGDAQGVLSGVVSGWRVNGITTIRSGVPIAISQFFAGSALSQLGGGTGYFGAQGLWMRPNFIPGCNKSAPGSRQYRAANGWFNTACFPTVDTGTTVAFGNAPRVDPSYASGLPEQLGLLDLKANTDHGKSGSAVHCGVLQSIQSDSICRSMHL